MEPGRGMSWEPGTREGWSPRPFDHFRTDGWSVYLADQNLLVWVLCDPDKNKVERKAGLTPDRIGEVLEWADGVIAGRTDGFTSPGGTPDR